MEAVFRFQVPPYPRLRYGHNPIEVTDFLQSIAQS